MRRLLFVLVPLFLQAEIKVDSCKYAEVTWQDAVLYSKTGGTAPLDKPNLLLSTVVSVGCMIVRPPAMIIVHSTTDSKVEDFLVVPLGWVVKVVVLQEVKSETSNSGSMPSRSKINVINLLADWQDNFDSVRPCPIGHRLDSSAHKLCRDKALRLFFDALTAQKRESGVSR